MLSSYNLANPSLGFRPNPEGRKIENWKAEKWKTGRLENGKLEGQKGGLDTGSMYVQYVQFIQPHVPACTTLIEIYGQGSWMSDKTA